MNLIQKIKIFLAVRKRADELTRSNQHLEAEVRALTEINRTLEILCEELSKQNKELKAQFEALNEMDAEALRLLQQELDLIFIENMEPIGEA
jgi:uncharacterized protein YaaN involved in tellurite resistance